MSAVAAERARPATTPARAERPERRHHRQWTPMILSIFTKFTIAYLVLPIAIMILYSFNRTSAASSTTQPKVVFRWLGFTTQWYRQWNGIPDLTAALKNTLVIGAASTVVATILGTLIALALVRYRFRGQSVLELVMFLNIAAPEIVLGASLLSFFVTLNVARGLFTIFLAHVMFNIAIVAVTVRARLAGFHRELEEAAQDLYANPWRTFVSVTMPLIWPGILAGGLLALVLSVDDFVTTEFVAGQTVTFPLWVYGAVKVGIPPQVFVMGTAIFGVGALVALFNIVGHRAREPARATEDVAA